MISPMGLIKDAKDATREAGELVGEAREAIGKLTDSASRATQVMVVIGAVALAALVLSVVAVLRARD